MFGKLVAGIAGGFLVAAFGVPLLGIVASQAGFSIAQLASPLFLALIIGTVIVAARARRTAKAWRYVLVAAGTVGLLQSMAHFWRSGNKVIEGVATGGEHAGEAIGHSLVSGFTGTMTFLIGLIVLLIGLLVGRDKVAG